MLTRGRGTDKSAEAQHSQGGEYSMPLEQTKLKHKFDHGRGRGKRNFPSIALLKGCTRLIYLVVASSLVAERRVVSKCQLPRL